MDPMPIKLGHMVANDELGFTLHNAAKTGNKKELKKVLDRGISVDYPNDEGQSPLFCACFEDKAGVAKLLLSNGANPNERSNEGITPVHVVCFTGNGDILSELLDHGGDLRLHDMQNRGAKDWAVLNPDSKKRKKVMDFLEKSRLFAMSKSGTDFMVAQRPDLMLARDKSLSALSRNNSVVKMLKARIGSSITAGLDMVKSVQSVGFGKVYTENDGNLSSGIISTVPLINENQLLHDDEGLTFESSLFMVMESMQWCQTPVTVKRIHSKSEEVGAVDLLINEMEYMGKLRHPNVLLLMGACQTDNLDGLVVIYERVSMGSLFNYLHVKNGSLPLERVKDIAVQVCDAMSFIHGQNIVHCSISSHAINFINQNSVKVGNFEYMTESGKRCSFSMNTFKHTLFNWMAPEIMRKSYVNEQTDVYSFCAVLWEMFKGEIPWSDLDAASTKVKLIKEKAQLPTDSRNIPVMYKSLLKFGLQLKPENRGISFNNIKHIITAAPEQDVEDYIREHCLVGLSDRSRPDSYNTNSSADSSSEQGSYTRSYRQQYSVKHAHGKNTKNNANNNFDHFENFVRRDDACSRSSGTWDATDLSEDENDAPSLGSNTQLRNFPYIGEKSQNDSYSPTTEVLSKKESRARMYPRISHLRAAMSNRDVKLENKPSGWSYLALQEWAGSSNGSICAKPASHQENLVNHNREQLTTAGSLYAIYNQMAMATKHGEGQVSSPSTSPKRAGINDTPTLKRTEHEYVEDNPEVIEASKDWYGGQGSVQNLISKFQTRAQDHSNYQALLNGETVAAKANCHRKKEPPKHSDQFQESRSLVEQWLQNEVGKKTITSTKQQTRRKVSDDEEQYRCSESESGLFETDSMRSLNTASMTGKESIEGIDIQTTASSQSDVISTWVSSEIQKVSNSLSKEIFQELRQRHATDGTDSSPLFDDSLDAIIAENEKIRNAQRKDKQIPSPDRGFEPEEYYFDDEIHPNLENESHMKLQLKPISVNVKDKDRKSQPETALGTKKQTPVPAIEKRSKKSQRIAKSKHHAPTLQHNRIQTLEEEVASQHVEYKRNKKHQRRSMKERSEKAAYRSTVRVRSSFVNPGEHFFTHTMTDLQTGKRSIIQKKKICAVHPDWITNDMS